MTIVHTVSNFVAFSEYMNFTVLTTKGSLSSEGILALVSLPKKGAKSYPANVQFDEDTTKLKIHSQIFSYLKKHLARYTLEPKGIRGIQKLLGDRILLLFDQPTFVGKQKQTLFDSLPPLSTQLRAVHKLCRLKISNF